MKRLAIFGLFALAACGGGSTTPKVAPAHDVTTLPAVIQRGGFGTYAYTSAQAGGQVEAAVPASPADPVVQRIEAYRIRMNKPAVFYVTAQLDNTGSAQDLKVNKITVVTDTGDQVELNPAWQKVGDWERGAKDNVGVELYNDLLKGGYALPGAKSSQVYVTETPIPSVKSVFVGGFVGTTSLMDRMAKTSGR